MKFTNVVILLSLFLLISCGEHGDLIKIQSLPAPMKEISGIEKFENEEMLWMINDSGNQKVLYGIIPGETNLEGIEISNGQNIDWEDLTRDEEGKIYIGDFGNNYNERKDLVIYKLSIPEDLDSDQLDAEKIPFKLSDQDKFPPEENDLNYDIEAFIHFGGNLYLFSKNRSSENRGTSKVYRLSDEASEEELTAEKITELQVCEEGDCKVTGAAYNKNSAQLALLTNDAVYLLDNFTGEDSFQKPLRKLDFKHSSKMESITFKNDTTLYLADEQAAALGRNLYEFPVTEK